MNKHRYFLLASLLVTTMLAASVPAPTVFASPLAVAWTVCANDPNDICYTAGNVGIGPNMTNPGELLHMLNGNLLIEGAGEFAVKMKRQFTFNGESGASPNPIFEWGRIGEGGDGDPQARFFYSDDIASERPVLEFDRKGIVASVKTARGSHFEGFIHGNEEPFFRLNSSPKMQLEMGNGGSAPVDVAVQRTATRTLTFRTNQSLDPKQPNWVERARITPYGLQITGGYLKLATSVNIPPAGDCNAANEVGRMKIDDNQAVLYVCTALGWRKMTLPAG